MATQILVNISSDNGLSPDRRQLNIWNNAGLIVNLTIGNHFQWTSIRRKQCSYNKMSMKMLSAKWQPFCLNLSVTEYLINLIPTSQYLFANKKITIQSRLIVYEMQTKVHINIAHNTVVSASLLCCFRTSGDWVRPCHEWTERSYWQGRDVWHGNLPYRYWRKSAWLGDLQPLLYNLCFNSNKCLLPKSQC